MAQTEVSDELCLGPTFAVAFSGCDLRCAFCITGRESWDARAGVDCDAGALAARAVAAQARGARSVMFLGGEPTLFLPAVLRRVAELPDALPVILKTNAHQSRRALRLAEGVFDLWLPDVKFGNDDCAQRLAGVENYGAVVRGNLETLVGRGERVLVRHLLMPGHVECCWAPVARWLAERLPGVPVSLRTAFWPAWQARRHPELSGPCSAAEIATARELAENLGLHLVS